MKHACLLLFGATSFGAISFLATASIADVGPGGPGPAAPGQIPECGTYQVQGGDTLGKIASRTPGFGVSDILDLNRDVIAAPDLLRVGQILKLPCAAESSSISDTTTQEESAAAIVPPWEAQAGEGLVDVLVRWGREAGFDVIVEQGSDWRFGVPFRHSGSFRGAVDEVLFGFSTAAVPPHVTFYTNNVMTIGAR